MTRMAWFCSGDDLPVALNQVAFVETERRLEDWIEADPSIAGDGLVVVGRQVPFDGGPADLLAIDPQGRWVVVEIKRGRNVRQDLAQALDYGSSLAYEPAESLRSRLAVGLQGKSYRETALVAVDAALADEGSLPREVALLVTGVGVHDATGRIQHHLRHYGMDVRVSTLEAHRGDDGRMVLIRDVEEPDNAYSLPPDTGEREAWVDGVELIRAIAQKYGVLPALDRWLAAVNHAGLLARPYKHSIMAGPPTHKNAYLMVARPVQVGGIRFNHGAEQFAQWFPWIPEESVERMLGPAVRGMGIVYTGEELDRYVTAVEIFLDENFPPPTEFESFMTQQPWDEERFLAAFTNRPDVQAKIKRLLAASTVSYGSGAIGQAHLSFSDGDPQILQLTTAGQLRGMWSLGSVPADDPSWLPLKELLGAWGGLGPRGQANRVNFAELTDADIESILTAALIVSEEIAASSA